MNFYTHDCDECIKLGANVTGGIKNDLYLCKKSPLWISLISRYGNDGPDYVSAPISVIENQLGANVTDEVTYSQMHTSLIMAYAMAHAKKLL